ncbi:MAG: ATP-binding protein [Thermomicrobiales bacterium]
MSARTIRSTASHLSQIPDGNRDRGDRHRIVRLPMPLSSFVGRQSAIASIAERFASPDMRLLTLTGPAGVGKTRLAVAAAAEIGEPFERIYFVGLIAVSQATLVPSAVARELGVGEALGSDPDQRLLSFLRERPTLLVLDNFEHVLDAAMDVANWLSACPELRILATSRSALRIRGEHEFVVQALTVDREHATAGEAVSLFADRARAFNPSFELNAENTVTISEICLKLDALPLAIELAAARTRVFSPTALLARIENRMALLTGGSRDLPAHQRTMRDAIAWSFDLLSQEERDLFESISVFAGTMGQGAMEIVGSNRDLDDLAFDELGSVTAIGLEFLGRSTALVEQSLLARSGEHNGEPRFALLATIREFAAERLDLSGNSATIRDRYARYFLLLAEAATTRFNSDQLESWLDRLELDYPNLAAAFDYFDATNNVEAMARLSGALQQYWQTRGQYSEGRRWLDRAISRARITPISANLLANALHGSAWLAIGQGDDRRARAIANESLALAQSIDDLRGVNRATSLLATIAYRAGEYESSIELHRSSLALSRETGDDYNIGVSLFRVALLTMELGRYEESLSLYEEAGAAFAEFGNEHGVGATIDNLGVALYCLGRYDEAVKNVTRALEIFRRFDDKRGIAVALDNLARCVLRQGDLQRGLEILDESLPLRLDLADQRGIAVWFESMAMLLTGAFADQQAVIALSAAQRLRASIGTPVAGHEQHDHVATIETLRGRLGDNEFAQLWAMGQTTTLDEAIAAAHGGTVEALDGLSTDRRVPSGSELSARELEVLALIKRRMTDREIAESLFISHRTVARHVSSILAKLGVGSRREAAALTAYLRK